MTVIVYKLRTYFLKKVAIIGMLIGVLRADQQMPDKHFVIIIPSYRNAQWVQQNLDSVRSQDYSNYHVYYIDDCSDELEGPKTVDLVEQYIAEHGLSASWTLLKNDCNYGALYNFYWVIHCCKSTDIIVELDGDDSFSHPRVLSQLNSFYADPEIWMTYGSYRLNETEVRGHVRPYHAKTVKDGSFRQDFFYASHLKSFYAGLFHTLALKDFLYHGQFFKKACDVAHIIPLLERAGTHSMFVSEILYNYNTHNTLTIYKNNEAEQHYYAQYIHQNSPYRPLPVLFPVSPVLCTYSVMIFNPLKPELVSRVNYGTILENSLLQKNSIGIGKNCASCDKDMKSTCRVIDLGTKYSNYMKREVREVVAGQIMQGVTSLQGKYTVIISDNWWLGSGVRRVNIESYIYLLDITQAGALLLVDDLEKISSTLIYNIGEKIIEQDAYVATLEQLLYGKNGLPRACAVIVNTNQLQQMMINSSYCVDFNSCMAGIEHMIDDNILLIAGC